MALNRELQSHVVNDFAERKARRMIIRLKERIRLSCSVGRGFGDDLEHSTEGRGGTWKLYSKILNFQAQSTLFSILPTAAL